MQVVTHADSKIGLRSNKRLSKGATCGRINRREEQDGIKIEVPIGCDRNVQ